MYVRIDVPFLTSWFINCALENAKNGRVYKKCSRFMKSVVNGAVKQDFMIICTNNQLISISWGLLKLVRTTLRSIIMLNAITTCIHMSATNIHRSFTLYPWILHPHGFCSQQPYTDPSFYIAHLCHFLVKMDREPYTKGSWNKIGSL